MSGKIQLDSKQDLEFLVGAVQDTISLHLDSKTSSTPSSVEHTSQDKPPTGVQSEQSKWAELEKKYLSKRRGKDRGAFKEQAEKTVQKVRSRCHRLGHIHCRLTMTMTMTIFC
jgi:hypothetical protein